MFKFIPNKELSWTASIFCFHLKKTTDEMNRLLREAYGEHAPPRGTCERRFRRFKSGDFNTKQGESQGTCKTAKKFEDVKLRASLNKDDSQTQKLLAEKLGVSLQAVQSATRDGKDSKDR